MDLATIRHLIRERSGLALDVTAAARLDERVGMRMKRLGVASLADYARSLHRDQAEFDALLSSLTVNETYFFREPAHLRVLTDLVVPRLLAAKRPGDRIRILSAGCSTGEEPYSIVIALFEKFGAGILASVDVVGADIDDEAVAKARAGVFERHSFRGIDDALKARYFAIAPKNRYAIRDAVRERVSLLKVNLLADDYPPALQRLDVIFYRNVSIYFEPATRRHVFTRLASVLNERGCLFLGSAETASHDIGVLSLTELGGAFLYEKRPASAADRAGTSRTPSGDATSEPTARRDRGATGRDPRPAAGVEPQGLVDEATSLALAGRYDDALARLDAALAQAPASGRAYALKACVLVKTARWAEAERACLDGLRRDPWNVDLHVLLGIVARTRGDDGDAVTRFREAVYLRSSCWPAHFHLAQIYRAAGDVERSCREFDIAGRLLRRRPAQEFEVGVFADGIPLDAMARLCDRHGSAARRRSP